MGGTPHWRRGYISARALRECATVADRLRCERIVAAWNRRPNHDWSPAIGTALTAGYRWLDVYCPGCGQLAAVDLAEVDRHPQAAITSLILSLRCGRCAGNGPLPKLGGLSSLPPDLIQIRKGGVSN
jgi:hypothetical protein